MKTYEQVKLVFRNLPSWYNQLYHEGVLLVLEEKGKLHACKHIRDTSNAQLATYGSTAEEFTLQGAKDLCDFIKPYVREPAEPQIVISPALLEETISFIKMALASDAGRSSSDIISIMRHVGEHKLVKELTNLQPK